MSGKNAIIVKGYVNKVSSRLKMRPEAEGVGTVNLSFFVVLFSLLRCSDAARKLGRKTDDRTLHES